MPASSDQLRILYVTGLWDGLADALFEGSPPRGMPAFHRPLQALIEGGHQLDLLIAAPELKPLAIECEWLLHARFTLVQRTGGHGIRSVLSTLALYRAVRRQLRLERYDFVYCHGGLGPVGIIAAHQAGLPCAQRTYGTFLSTKTGTGRLSAWRKLKLFLRHPLEYLNFSLVKDFQLITNDGSRGDQVFRQLGSRQTPLYFWVNGTEMDSNPAPPAELPVSLDPPYLLYPARIAPWKQQHLAVELLAELQQRGQRHLRLLFAGHGDDAGYLAEIRSLAQQLDVAGSIEFLGPVTQPVLKTLMGHSTGVLSFYRSFNLGNVAIETLACGGVLIALDDGSLNEFVQTGHSGFLIKDMVEGAQVVERLLESPDLAAQVKHGALQAAHQHFPPWPDRVQREIELIRQSVAKRRAEAP